jgi:hypothetical protein
MIIIVPSLNGAVMTVGDFVIAKRCQSSSVVRSVCVIREVQQSALRVTWYLTLEELSQEGYLELPQPPSLEENSNLLKCRLKEVCETYSESGSLISVNDVVDIAFVFMPTLLKRNT